MAAAKCALISVLIFTSLFSWSKAEVDQGVESRVEHRRVKRQTPTTQVNLTPAQIESILDLHNDIRRAVNPTASNMKELEWNLELQTHADNYAATCRYGTNPTMNTASFPNIGENLYPDSTFTNPDAAINAAFQLWLGEQADYTYTTNNCLSSCSRYTQVIWAEARYIGCSIVQCPDFVNLGPSFDNGVVVRCNYDIGSSTTSSPYQTGPACSACPAACPCCNNGLCTDDCPSTTTTEPTTTGPTTEEPSTVTGPTTTTTEEPSTTTEEPPTTTEEPELPKRAIILIAFMAFLLALCIAICICLLCRCCILQARGPAVRKQQGRPRGQAAQRFGYPVGFSARYLGRYLWMNRGGQKANQVY